jgi:protoheme IX farnesyltransferase
VALDRVAARRCRQVRALFSIVYPALEARNDSTAETAAVARVSTRLARQEKGRHNDVPLVCWSGNVSVAGQPILQSRTPHAQWRRRLRAYTALTKPRIIELLLVTTIPTMFVAAHGVPSLWLMLATTLGGIAAAASANAVNCWLDRDIDALMARTAHRPLVRSEVTPRNALRFGIVLGVVAFVWLALTVNVLAAVLAAAANLFYVVVYTMGLKRRTAQNIVIGGAAGCVPVLVGWAAVTGTIELPALLLFAIVFAWTPPHFWTLAMRYRRDYERAGVPMMPVVMGTRETARQILLYTVLLVAVTLMFGAVADLGLLYLLSALGLGAGYIHMAVRLWQTPTAGTAMAAFKYSITYLGLLFTAMAVDAVLFSRPG